MKQFPGLLLLLPFTLAAVAVGQSRSSGANAPSAPAPPGLMLPNGTAAHDEDGRDARFERRVQEARKLDRKKRMVDTANRLLALTTQLQNDLKGRAPTPEDDKRLDEIARLARQVKDQMRQ